MHGGTSTGAPISTGRYSVKHNAELQAKIDHFAADSSPGDLTGELALSRAVLQSFLGTLAGNPSQVETGHILDMVESIGRMVERIARILNQTALTQAERQLLVAVLADVAPRYIAHERLNDFFKELGAAFSGRSVNSSGGGALLESVRCVEGG